MAANAALVVAEGRNRLDSADQPPFWPLPDQRHPVAEPGKGKLERLHCRCPVASVETRLELVKAKLPALSGRKPFRSALPGLEGKKGGREY